MQLCTFGGAEGLGHLRGLVRRQGVRDDVDLAVALLRGHNPLQERDELITGVPHDWPAQHHAGLSRQRRIHRQRSVAHVLKPVAFRASTRQQQNGARASLNRRPSMRQPGAMHVVVERWMTMSEEARRKN
jgi:hypothetical protein